MAIITVSRGCFSHGREIAETVAEMLGYTCVSREILVDASQLFDVSERKLIQSIHDAPGILERITQGREHYLAYIQAALLEHVRQNNVVYHGHAGHLLLAEIPKVLKVRVLADLADRIDLLQQQQNISKEKALALIQEEDHHRARWTRYLYKMDLNDPQLYDIVIKIGSLTVLDACDIICKAAQSDFYKTTPESTKALNDLAITHHLKAALKPICDAEITARDGNVRIKVAAQKIRKTGQASLALRVHIFTTIQEDLTRQLHEIARKIPGIKDVVINVDLPYYS